MLRAISSNNNRRKRPRDDERQQVMDDAQNSMDGLMDSLNEEGGNLIGPRPQRRRLNNYVKYPSL